MQICNPQQEMNMADSYDTYEDNSPQAVLRVALAVAFADDLLDHEEHAKVEQVYRDIRASMDIYEGAEDAYAESENIAEYVLDSVSSAESDEDLAELWEEWADAVVDSDLQELAVLAALRIAGVDADIDADESECMNAFCDIWGLELDEIMESLRN
jgi:tellurite resistance protein